MQREKGKHGKQTPTWACFTTRFRIPNPHAIAFASLRILIHCSSFVRLKKTRKETRHLVIPLPFPDLLEQETVESCFGGTELVQRNLSPLGRIVLQLRADNDALNRHYLLGKPSFVICPGASSSAFASIPTMSGATAYSSGCSDLWHVKCSIWFQI